MEREKYISLVAQLRQVALARALALLGDHAAAEDVAGEVLLRLWERHDGLHDDPEKVSRLASVMALNHLRHRRRHPIMRIFHRKQNDEDDAFNIPDLPAPRTPQQDVEDQETGHIVRCAMRPRLHWRKVVEMREYEKMSFAEIARVLGTTESSCRGLMSKARARLVQLITQTS